MYAVGQNLEQKLVCKKRSEICLMSRINFLNHFASLLKSSLLQFHSFYAYLIIILLILRKPTLYSTYPGTTCTCFPTACRIFSARQLLLVFFILTVIS